MARHRPNRPRPRRRLDHHPQRGAQPRRRSKRLAGRPPGSHIGDDWLLRAAVAVEEPYVNLPQEALYPVASVDSSGNQLTGTNAYDIHFAPGQLPPVGAFWSVTLYNQAGSLVANPLNKYSVGSLTPGLVTNPDGSLDIRIQNTEPASGPANWLPAPAGPFYLTSGSTSRAHQY